MFDRLRKKEEECVTTRKILICRTEEDLIACRKQVAKIGGKIVKELPLVHGLVFELPNVISLAELESDSKIARIDDDITFHTLCWNFFTRKRQVTQKPQEIGWGVKRIGAPEAWGLTRGAQIKVAVIDTGVELNHPDLRQRLAKGYNAISPIASANDDNGHGTHVAGIIAASDNDIGIVGVSPEVVIHPVKVLDGNGGGSLSDVVSGIQWCIDNKIDIINMSLGASEASETFRQAVKLAADQGIIIVAAAGNSGPGPNTIDYPAKYPETIAVAACDRIDKIADFSSRGPEVDITAPGVDIESTYTEGKYSTLSGTSMATPHVTGTIALLKSLKHSYSLGDIKSILKRSAQLLPDFTAELQGVGLIQAGTAVNKFGLH